MHLCNWWIINMGIITLISDMGIKDHAVAVVKGAIYSQLPEAVIVDISHSVSPFDTNHAAMMLRHTYHEFPKGTIHVIGVNPDASAEIPHLVVEYNGHYFIGADNGVFSLIFDKTPDAVYELNLDWESDELTFPVRTIFVRAACHLARGGTPEVIGKQIQDIRQAERFRPLTEANALRGHVTHIDRYGNAHTNITYQLFKEVGKGREFYIQFRRRTFDIRKISSHYNNVPEGEKVAIFNHSKVLEIAINKGTEGNGGGAARLFNLSINSVVRIQFNENKDSQNGL